MRPDEGPLHQKCGRTLIWRAICIPQATFHWNLLGVIYDILLMPNVLGVTPVDLATRILIYGWIFMVLAVTIVQYVLRRALPWRLPTLWLLCALVACLPGLQLARPNLLFFPMTFSTLFLCAVLAGISRSSAPLKAVVAGILVCALAGEFYVSSLTMQSFHPDSITAIAWNAELIYPASGVQVHIPADRWAAQAQQLAALGIHSAAEAKLRIPQLTAQAKAGRHYSPGPDGVPFLPLLQAIAQP